MLVHAQCKQLKHLAESNCLTSSDYRYGGMDNNLVSLTFQSLWLFKQMQVVFGISSQILLKTFLFKDTLTTYIRKTVLILFIT